MTLIPQHDEAPLTIEQVEALQAEDAAAVETARALLADPVGVRYEDFPKPRPIFGGTGVERD